MDRRQRKTREAIFKAFANLLSKKDFNQITVGEIIDDADVGRATFYSHFETKDFLLKDFCEELFCHIFDIENDSGHEHKHIFDCEGTDSVFLHLFQHLQKNDNNVLLLLLSQNNDLFLRYFKRNLVKLVEDRGITDVLIINNCAAANTNFHIANIESLLTQSYSGAIAYPEG